MRNNVAMVLSRVALSTEFENSLVSDLLIDIHNLKKSGGIHHLKVIIDVLCRDLPEVMGVQELSAELVNFILNHPQYSAVFPTSFKVTNHLPTAAGFLNHPQHLHFVEKGWLMSSRNIFHQSLELLDKTNGEVTTISLHKPVGIW